MSFFLAVPWAGRHCVIVVFPRHTHLLFSEKEIQYPLLEIIIFDPSIYTMDRSDFIKYVALWKIPLVPKDFEHITYFLHHIFHLWSQRQLATSQEIEHRHTLPAGSQL